jgi:hypothetical protein
VALALQVQLGWAHPRKGPKILIHPNLNLGLVTFERNGVGAEKNKGRNLYGLGSSQIIYLNLREFKKMIVRYHLWDTPYQIKFRLPN